MHDENDSEFLRKYLIETSKVIRITPLDSINDIYHSIYFTIKIVINSINQNGMMQRELVDLNFISRSICPGWYLFLYFK